MGGKKKELPWARSSDLILYVKWMGSSGMLLLQEKALHGDGKSREAPVLVLRQDTGKQKLACDYYLLF